MKKFVLVVNVLVIFFLIGLMFLNNKPKELEGSKEVIKQPKMLSMNLEQTSGAGDYKTVTQSNWPTDGYEFNEELSRCENGSTLSWDDTKNAVIVSGSISDRCYVYFDKNIDVSTACVGKTLKDCVITHYTGKQGKNKIYYHDSSLTNGAGDNSYRYAGANPNNYVCFGSDVSPCPTDNLYRIIGVIDDKVKLIKADFASSALLGKNGDYAFSGTPNSSYKGSLTKIDGYYWNKTSEQNTWSISSLNTTNLNTNFINNIGSTWASKIVITTWKVGGGDFRNFVSKIVYQNEVVNPQAGQYSATNETEYSAKIGLMYVSDYGFAAIPDAWTLTMGSYNNLTATNNNWIYIGDGDWTITPMTTMVDYVNVISSDGQIVIGFVGMDSFGARPVFNLDTSIEYVSGAGTQNDPIIIK